MAGDGWGPGGPPPLTPSGGGPTHRIRGSREPALPLDARRAAQPRLPGPGAPEAAPGRGDADAPGRGVAVLRVGGAAGDPAFPTDGRTGGRADQRKAVTRYDAPVNRSPPPRSP